MVQDICYTLILLAVKNDSAKVESVINLFQVQSSFNFNGEGRSGYAAFDW